MKMKNKTYDILKFIALLVLPISEFIGSLSSIWGFQYGQQIVATLVALDVLLGYIVKAASDAYAQSGGDEDE